MQSAEPYDMAGCLASLKYGYNTKKKRYRKTDNEELYYYQHSVVSERDT